MDNVHRVCAAPNRATFTIRPIRELVIRYVGNGKGWVDPFAGFNSPAEFTNDLNPDCPVDCHFMADEYCKVLDGQYKGVLFDPPYSYRQIKECYGGFGLKPTALDTSANFYNRVMNAICDKIKDSGYAISFGWNSNGFGKNRGFEIIETLLVAHGDHHNDTIVVVERKIVCR